MSTWLGLAGQHAVVAGAGGIGAAVAESLAQEGVDVLVLDRDEAALDAIAQPGQSGRGAITGLPAELSTGDACRAAFRHAVDTLSEVHIFVHAVGVNDRRPALDIEDDAWRRLLAINLDSAFWLGQAAGRHMTARGYGRIVYLSSVSGLLAHPHHAPYAATKGGVNQLMRVFAREWAPNGVTVNAIAPGYTETGLTRAYLDDHGMRAPLEALVPAGRLGTPADLTGPITFLASRQSAFVTGQVLYVDGGRTLV
ncbi:MAG TPA: SDR family oxidoreductase [Pseudonocardiaceae bacterium]|nr:SDR family oxidoreductase [Pseudonocardiaceae bacterium]